MPTNNLIVISDTHAGCRLGLCPLTAAFEKDLQGARISEPQLGGIVIRQGDEEYYYRRKVWSMDRSPVEE